MSLAIFDLDNTLLAGDSDYLWGQFLVERGIVDGEHYEASNRRFYEAYQQGTLDIMAFLRFSLAPLAQNDPAQLHAWRDEFMLEKIEPIVLPKAEELIESHRAQGHTLMIITATNFFVTEPIARRFGIDHLLATQPEMKSGRFTGEVSGIPTFQHGKVRALEGWLQEQAADLEESWFYSDSHNDIPLLERVKNPVVVDADSQLTVHAQQRGWKALSLRC